MRWVGAGLTGSGYLGQVLATLNTLFHVRALHLVFKVSTSCPP